MSIGERITDLRNKKEFSQGGLAKILGVSRQAVSKWENDQSSPDTLNLIKLADVLETDVEFLATGRQPVYQPAPIVVNLVKKEERSQDRIYEKVVEKPVIHKVVRVKYRRNPTEYAILAIVSFAIGLAVGLLF